LHPGLHRGTGCVEGGSGATHRLAASARAWRGLRRFVPTDSNARPSAQRCVGHVRGRTRSALWPASGIEPHPAVTDPDRYALVMVRTRPKAFLRMIQHQAARVSITASTTRGQGSTGVVEAGRDFMRGLRVSRFGTARPQLFQRTLDAETEELQASLPRRARSWGLARKLLNIFLRDCLYSGYLGREHDLERAEQYFEIPLDSITAKHIRDECPQLPPWPGVKHLTPDVSAAYQLAALLAAGRRGVARVHMDAYWWGARE